MNTVRKVKDFKQIISNLYIFTIKPYYSIKCLARFILNMKHKSVKGINGVKIYLNYKRGRREVRFIVHCL